MRVTVPVGRLGDGDSRWRNEIRGGWIAKRLGNGKGGVKVRRVWY